MNNGKGYVIGLITDNGIEYIEMQSRITIIKYDSIAKLETHSLIQIPDKLDNFRVSSLYKILILI